VPATRSIGKCRNAACRGGWIFTRATSIGGRASFSTITVAPAPFHRPYPPYAILCHRALPSIAIFLSAEKPSL